MLSCPKRVFAMKAHFVSLILFVVIGVGGSAHGDCSVDISCFASSGLLRHVAIVGKKDNRFTYDDYKLAQNNIFKTNLTTGQVHSLTSGTGAFFCGGSSGGANLVMRNNLLLLTAHEVLKYSELEKKHCTGRLSVAELAKCQFRTIDGNGRLGDHSYFIDPSTLRLGDYCNSPDSMGHDWAIVELQEDVVGAQYYNVLNAETIGTSDDDYDALKGFKVVVTSARNSNFKRDGVLMNVPTLCDGVMGFFLNQENSLGQFQYRQTTNCSSGNGNSGGGLIVPMGAQRPSIIGVMSASNDDNSIYDHDSYSLYNFSGGPLIEGDLAKVLKSCSSKC